MNIFYSLTGVREVVYMVLIPLFVTLVLYGLFVFFYSMKMRNKNQREKNYVISFWSSVIGIVFGAVLLSVSIGFVIAFVKRVEAEGLVVNNQLIYTLFCCFPVIPFLFLISFIYRFLKNLKEKAKIEELDDGKQEKGRNRYE